VRAIRRYWKRWLIAGVVAVAVLAVAGPYVYINHIQDEPPAALARTPPASAAASGAGGGTREGIEGAWRVSGGSQAGYRVDEVLFGQNVTAVGRTDEVTGDLEIEGTRAVSGTVTVALASVESDSPQRDSQFRGSIMNTEQFPNATFTLTEPVDLASAPQMDEQLIAHATGDLTIRGETNPVTLEIAVQRTADGLRVNGSIPVTFADYGTDPPNFGGIAVEDTGTSIPRTAASPSWTS
jgi:polyisoprenoid-binding protein YceI